MPIKISLVKNLKKNKVGAIYRRLFDRFGPQHWWPGESPFEIMVGAVLTQNTSWRNAERAIENLKSAHLLAPKKIHTLPVNRLAHLIRPSGFYRLKARRLKPLVRWFLVRYRGNPQALAEQKIQILRPELLNLPGIGPETADSILLYALNKPVFVVDAYTKRVFSRHQFFTADARYPEIQDFFMSSLPRDYKLFNEYHALIVKLAKTYCKSNPLCADCPLA
jgi:endonuclease-3 related protein